MVCLESVLFWIVRFRLLVSHCDSYHKEIDATEDPNDQLLLEKLIENFGTHYPKESIMGIGVDFETRYTEAETVYHDDRTRLGLELLGF